jgi:hypothetical protein
MRAMLLSASVLAVLSLVTPATAQEIKGDLKPKLYGFAVLTVDAPGSAVLWRVTPAPVQKEVKENVLRFGGQPNVPYSVTATVINWDKRSASEAEAVVRFGPGPDPGPGPEPKPPDPISPAAERIRQAFTATGFTKARELAAGYDECAGLAMKAAGKTGAAVHAEFRAALKAAMGNDKIPEAVIAAVGLELADMPAAGPNAFAAADMLTAKFVCERIAQLVRQAGGLSK